VPPLTQVQAQTLTLRFKFLCDDSSTLPLDAHTGPAARMPRPERPVYVCTYMFIPLDTHTGPAARMPRPERPVLALYMCAPICL
jgi:hypothetical protein